MSAEIVMMTVLRFVMGSLALGLGLVIGSCGVGLIVLSLGGGK